jgi:hypothetical protein
MMCPTFDNLIEMADGRLAPDEKASVERHAAGCGACSATLRWYEGFVLAAATDASFDPPVWVTRRAIDLFGEAREAASRRGLRGLVARLRAALVFDSLGGALAADAIPARRGPIQESRQLLFSAPSYDIDMLVAPADAADALRVTGQVLGAEGGFEGVRNLRVELAGVSVQTTEFGEFAFENVAPGVYEVRLVDERREIILTDVPVALG